MEAAQASVFRDPPESTVSGDPAAEQLQNAQNDEERAEALADQVMSPLAREGHNIDCIFNTGYAVHKRALEMFHSQDPDGQ